MPSYVRVYYVKPRARVHVREASSITNSMIVVTTIVIQFFLRFFATGNRAAPTVRLLASNVALLTIVQFIAIAT